MTIPPTHTILIIGNRYTGKTSYIQRIIAEYDASTGAADTAGAAGDSSYNRQLDLESTHMNPLTIHNINETIRVIELNDSCITLTPDQYVPFITKIIVFAAFDDADSIFDIQFHINNHIYLNVPIEIVINKRDRRQFANPDAIQSISSIDIRYWVHFMSAKYDGNVSNLLV
jgi:hypothetical protein